VSAADDVHRMLVLVPWLLERPGAHVDEMADVFATSPDQIRRDLALLDFCGLPGLRGGDLFDVTIINDRATIDLADELRRPLKPTATEAVRLVLLVDAVRIALDDAIPALTSASNKLRAMLSLPNERLGLVDDELVEQPFTPLRTALHAKRQVTFAYLGRNDTTPKRRHVDPVRIHVLDGNWYLEAFDHDRQAGRIFLMDRIADVDVLEATAENHQFLDLTPTYEPNDSDTTVVLHVTRHGQWVLDQLVLTDTQTHEDGSITATLTTNALPYVARLVFMARGTVTVQQPDVLRQQVASMASQALALYRQNSETRTAL